MYVCVARRGLHCSIADALSLRCVKHPATELPFHASREASEKQAEAQGLLGVAERNAQLSANLATAQERALQLQERAEALEQALEERDASAEAAQLLQHRVRPCHESAHLAAALKWMTNILDMENQTAPWRLPAEEKACCTARHARMPHKISLQAPMMVHGGLHATGGVHCREELSSHNVISARSWSCRASRPWQSRRLPWSGCALSWRSSGLPVLGWSRHWLPALQKARQPSRR